MDGWVGIYYFELGVKILSPRHSLQYIQSNKLQYYLYDKMQLFGGTSIPDIHYSSVKFASVLL
jgi:hypothetical protein